MNILKKYLCFGMLLIVCACNQHASKEVSNTFTSFDFNHPVKLELKLTTKKANDAWDFCNFRIPHTFECTVKVFYSSDSTQSGETILKINAKFSRKELTDLISSAEKKYQSVGVFTFTLSQETNEKIDSVSESIITNSQPQS
jgi:ERCC4-type nuclease